MLKIVRLQQSQCPCIAMAWLRKSSKLFEGQLDYSDRVEHLMNTAYCTKTFQPIQHHLLLMSAYH